jgi:hypothetical protein
MAGKRIGELLAQIVGLSPHDVEEILHEQSATRKPFGDIALAMGLCRPEHVWKAWCGQLLDSQPRRIDLKTFGVDTQAISLISAQTAQAMNLIPVRVLGEVLIVAIDSVEAIDPHASKLTAQTGKQVRFVLADRRQIRRAIARHYPSPHLVG